MATQTHANAGASGQFSRPVVPTTRMTAPSLVVDAISEAIGTVAGG